MTPPNPLASQQSSQSSPQQGQSPLFAQQQQDSQQQDAQSAAKQLISEMASIHSALQGLAQSHPEMAQNVDQAFQVLQAGMDKVISGMQGESRGNQPAYA